MKTRLIILSLLCTGLVCGCKSGAGSFRTGSTLPMWQEGWLDIHAINTGRGESFWFILPDGTTMLLDASGSMPEETHPLDPPGCTSRPSPDISLTTSCWFLALVLRAVVWRRFASTA